MMLQYLYPSWICYSWITVMLRHDENFMLGIFPITLFLLLPLSESDNLPPAWNILLSIIMLIIPVLCEHPCSLIYLPPLSQFSPNISPNSYSSLLTVSIHKPSGYLADFQLIQGWSTNGSLGYYIVWLLGHHAPLNMIQTLPYSVSWIPSGTQ